MSPHLLRRPSLLAPLALAALAACQDSTAPRPAFLPGAQFAQGDNNTWTVNTLADPSAGPNGCDEVECTLREAILAAAPGGTIVFANGLQGSINLDAGRGYLLIAKDLTVDGAGRITIDAKGGSRVMLAAGDGLTRPKVRLTGLRLTGGNSDRAAGGLGAFYASLIVDRVVVAGNRTSYADGGGIYLESSVATLTTSRVDSNVATGDDAAGARGGGIYVDENSELTLVSTTVYGNKTDGGLSTGGGIFNEGSLAVTASTIAGNLASMGGNGGGLFNAFEATARVDGSTISGNSARDGGGIYNSGSLEMRSSTLTRNSGADGPGLRSVFTVRVFNSIIAGNVGGECDAAVFSLGHNLTTATGGCAFTAPTDVSVQFLTVFSDVLEQELKDNGGPTKTHALISRGRAVDVGYCPGETKDQRGFTRPVDDAIMPNAVDGCDIGAYELQGPVAAVADLMVSQTVDKPSAKQGEQVTYTVRVQNLGPQTAPGVVVNDVLSDGVTFVEARANRGLFNAPPRGETGTVTWTLGDMVNGANEVAYISVTVLIRGRSTVTNTATVTGAVADPNTANNTAAITVSVGSGGSGSPRKPR